MKHKLNYNKFMTIMSLFCIALVSANMTRLEHLIEALGSITVIALLSWLFVTLIMSEIEEKMVKK